MTRLLTLFTLLLTVLTLSAKDLQDGTRRIKYKDYPAYIYRVSLTDKQGCPYSLDHPTHFLTRRSIERRKRQGLSVDSTDLPVSPRYVKQLVSDDVTLVGQSRWHNALLLRMKDTTHIARIRQEPFVRSCQLVWLSPDSVEVEGRPKFHEQFDEHDSIKGEIYGITAEQIQCLQGDRLHKAGLLGQDMMIAVLDGGFKNVDRIPEFHKIDIRITPQEPQLFAETDHGTKVLSAMAIYHPYYFVGTAPKASYWLLRSEDQQSEQVIEEDYWTMAAEFADSVGCDVINSSLGYNEYDHKWMNYQLWQLDGKTAFVSQTASMLADKDKKNLFLCTGKGIKKIDLAKGKPEGVNYEANFNYRPYEEREYIFNHIWQQVKDKFYVVAIGAPARLVSGRGTITSGMGTSFSSPIICGLAACLWQGLPHKTAKEIIELIRQNSDNYSHPDNIYGFGLPNFWRAFMIGRANSENE